MIFRSIVEDCTDVDLKRALLAYGARDVLLGGEGLVPFVDFIGADGHGGGEFATREDGGAGQLLCGRAGQCRGVVGEPAVEELKWEQA